MTVVDLSMNESPYPPVAAVRAVVEAGAATLQRYPDHLAGELVAALAAHLGVPAERVLLGPGSAGLTQLLLQSLDPDRPEIVYPTPSFEGYPLMVRNVRARPVPVPLAGYALDLAAMAEAVTPATRCVLLCNPNNPTGAILAHDELAKFLARIPTEVPVIIDEAYRDFVTDPAYAEGLALAREHGNVCVLRTFSKAYGLAALRVGYAVAPASIAEPARTVGLVFYPGGPAQAAALACLHPEVRWECSARCAELAETRERLRAGLVAAGLPVAPSQANFLWLPLGERAGDFADRCRRAGILVRTYPGVGVRVTVGTAAANERLLAVAGAR